MRMLPLAGLVLSGLFFTPLAHAACEIVVDPQQVTITGPGKYCLNANRSLPIEIYSSNVELDCGGRTLANSSPNGGPGSAQVGIRVNPGVKVIVRNCRIDGFPTGIDMNTQSGAQLLNNTVLRSQDTSIAVRGGNNDPLAEPARIVGNRVIGYDHSGNPPWGPALRLVGLGRGVISNNVVAGYTGPSGLDLLESPDVQLLSNQFLDSQGASRIIRLEQSPRAQIIHNTIMPRRPGEVAPGMSGAIGATCLENVFINTVRSGFSECADSRDNVEQPTPPMGH